MTRLLEASKHWLDDRPTMKEDNLVNMSIIHLFCGEVGEFCEATSGKSLQEMKESVDVREELGDLILYLLNIFYMLELDPQEVGMEKLALNMLRYIAADYSEGKDFKREHGENKRNAKTFGMKQNYYAVAS